MYIIKMTHFNAHSINLLILIDKFVVAVAKHNVYMSKFLEKFDELSAFLVFNYCILCVYMMLYTYINFICI